MIEKFLAQIKEYASLKLLLSLAFLIFFGIPIFGIIMLAWFKVFIALVLYVGLF